MNVFKRAAHVVTKPITATKDAIDDTRALLRIRDRALKLYRRFKGAAADPTEYHSPDFWAAAAEDAVELADALPLPHDVKGQRQMKDVIAKVVMGAGTVAALAEAVQQSGAANFLPPQYMAAVGMVGAIAAAVAGVYHQVPAHAEPTKP